MPGSAFPFSFDAIYYHVKDIQAAVDYLASKGVKASPAKPEVGGVLSLFHDPDGNELCLWQNA